MGKESIGSCQGNFLQKSGESDYKKDLKPC